SGLLAVGCAGGHDAGSKQVDELKEQISKLRTEQASLVDRLERAEIELRNVKQAAATTGQKPALPSSAPAPPADAADGPDLAVVHLGPEADNDDPDADTPRPVLRASGDSGMIQEHAGGKVLLDDRKEGGDAGKKKAPWSSKKPGIKAGAGAADKKK